MLAAALAAAQGIENERYRARVLTSLAPQLTGEQVLAAALAAAQDIEDADARADALTSLAPQLTGEQVLALPWRQCRASTMGAIVSEC